MIASRDSVRCGLQSPFIGTMSPACSVRCSHRIAVARDHSESHSSVPSMSNVRMPVVQAVSLVRKMNPEA